MRTLSALAAALDAGTITARSLVEDCLARIADPNGEGARTFLKVHAAKARAMMTAIETLSHAFGRAIATDETLRTNVYLGVYQPDFQNPTAAPPSPYDAALNTGPMIDRAAPRVRWTVLGA